MRAAIKKKDFSNTPLRVVKRQRPKTIQILCIVKNPEKANNSPSYRYAAINHND